MSKYLSVNCHIHQNVSASELNKRQPVLDFLAPTNAQTAPLDQPAQRAFDDPPARWELRFAGDGTGFKRRFAPAATMFDMSDVAFLLDKLMHILIVISTVHAKVLFKLGRIRAAHHNRDNQVVGAPFIMAVRTGNEHCQWCAALVHQQVYFATALTAISRVSACRVAAQRGRTAFAVERLPTPFDLTFLGIELDHNVHDLVENAILLPVLKALMQRAATYTEPVFVHSFPLAARPQHIPNAIQHRPIVRRRSPRSALPGRFRQHLLDLPPQWTRYTKVIDFFRFWGRVFFQDASRLVWLVILPFSAICVSFSCPNLIYG